MQLLLVWLLPIAGAQIVRAVHRCEEWPWRRHRDPGDDFAASARAVERLTDAIDGA